MFCHHHFTGVPLRTYERRREIQNTVGGLGFQQDPWRHQASVRIPLAPSLAPPKVKVLGRPLLARAEV